MQHAADPAGHDVVSALPGPHRAAPPSVSVRATILALGRYTRTAASEVQALEKRWNRYRKQHQLARDGQPEDTVAAPRQRTRVPRRMPQG